MGMAVQEKTSIFVYGGSIMPGIWNGKQVTIQDKFLSFVGVSYAFMGMSMAASQEFGKCSLPFCWVMCRKCISANTMASR